MYVKYFPKNNYVSVFVFDVIVCMLSLFSYELFFSIIFCDCFRYEQEIISAATQALPDDDDDPFDN